MTAPANRALKSEIMALLRDFSVEKTPAELARRDAWPAELPQGSRVYITWIAGNHFDKTLRAAVRLREFGMEPVPHLAARAVVDANTLDAMLASLRREAGVDQALLIAGAMRTPAGAFDSTLPALASGLFERHGFRALAIAGHPEGSPDIAADALQAALAAKNRHAAASGLSMRVVTQFCFDGAPVVAWERRTRAAGNRLPIHIGLAGLATLPTLIRFARICGVGASLGVLTRQAGRLFRLMSAVAPGEVVVALARARLADPACLIEGCHFFPFGAFGATVAWAAAVARGDFHLNNDASDIVVE